MAQVADAFDLGRLRLTPGEGRRLDLDVEIAPFTFGGEAYGVSAGPSTLGGRVPVRLDLSRMTGGGHALRLRFGATLGGPCQRCLEPAEPGYEIDVREVDRPGGGEELASPYVEDDVLDLGAWARDALALALPVQLLCRPDCAGLCPECGADLNREPGHGHEAAPDPRWAKLRELKLD